MVFDLSRELQIVVPWLRKDLGYLDLDRSEERRVGKECVP